MIKVEVDYSDVWMRGIDNESFLTFYLASGMAPTGSITIKFSSPKELIELAKEIIAVCQEV